MSRISRWRNAVLVLARDRRAPRSLDELLALEPEEEIVGLRASRAVERRERAEPEDLADDGRVLEQPLLVLGERVEARGDDSLDGVGQLFEIALLEQHAGVLLGVERVAPGPGEKRLLGLRIQQRLLEQRLHQAGRLLVRERRERDRERVRLAAAPAGPPLEQLRAGGAEHEQGHAA